MAYDLTISDIQSITDVEVAFSTTRLLPDWSDIPDDFKAGNSYTTLVKAILFNTPLPAGEVEIVDGVTPEQLNRLVRSHLGSFSTKHEPVANPVNYRTLSGLLKATTRTLQRRAAGVTRGDGQSVGMWLHNAQYCAENQFKAGDQVRKLVATFAITRPQDLQGGHSVFGIPLPTRPYITGDNIPGIGTVSDETEEQLLVGATWYHRKCFDPEPATSSTPNHQTGIEA